MLRVALCRTPLATSWHGMAAIAASPLNGMATTAPTVVADSLVAGVAEQRRFLKFAKSTFGYRIFRRGQRSYPMWRKPLAMSSKFRTKLNVPLFWRYNMPKDVNNFLPRENYVTEGTTGHFALPKSSYFTLQHITSGVPIRIKRFPTFYTFTNANRWLIGTRLQAWALPRASIVDEVAISKRQRLVYVKLGRLPKE
jgi:hypothetical protein